MENMPAVIFIALLDLGKKSSFMSRHWLVFVHKCFFSDLFPPQADKCSSLNVHPGNTKEYSWGCDSVFAAIPGHT
jgi:hypothetical protein